MCLARMNNFPQLTRLENQESNPGLFRSKAQVLATIYWCYLVSTGRKSVDASAVSFLFFRFSPFIFYVQSGIFLL